MAALVNRLRANSLPLQTIPPKLTSAEYSPELASLAAQVLYRSPLPSPDDLPLYILDSAALPNANQDYYDQLLPYVLSRLPEEEELIGGLEYEIVFFAGGNNSGYGQRRRGSTGEDDDDEEEEGGNSFSPVLKPHIRRSNKPGFGWFMKAYNVLTRATRKRLKKLWIVHERKWVRVLVEMFATVVSPKSRKKIVHVSSLTALALHMPIENLLIPPSAYITDRKRVPDIYAPYASGKRAYGAMVPFPSSAEGQPRLPRVLRETTAFILTDPVIQTEGLFRVSARQQTVEFLREAYDRGQKFIIWREGSVLQTAPPHREGHGDVVIDPDDLSHLEGYDVHTAAALIKLWYKELAEPIFPPPSYEALLKYHSSTSAPPTPAQLEKMLNPGVEYSILSARSRQILTVHLLPLLSDVASNSSTNKMPPSNLAVCFAPILLRGPDPIEDIKVSAIVRTLLTAMIEAWPVHLAAHLGLTNDFLASTLQLPTNPADREDPLDQASETKSPGEADVLANQVSGITLADEHESSSDVPVEASLSSDADSDTEASATATTRRNTSVIGTALQENGQTQTNDFRPVLPPRPESNPRLQQNQQHQQSQPFFPLNNDSASSIGIPARKPAPKVVVKDPPRYSTVFGRPTATVECESPTTTIRSERGSVMTLPPYEEGLFGREMEDAMGGSISNGAHPSSGAGPTIPSKSGHDPAPVQSPESGRGNPSQPESSHAPNREISLVGATGANMGFELVSAAGAERERGEVQEERGGETVRITTAAGGTSGAVSTGSPTATSIPRKPVPGQGEPTG